MAAQPGRVRVYQHAQAVAFQVEGQATMQHSPAVRRYAEQNLTVGTTALSVDLRRYIHMDSTFLGTLLFLKRLDEFCSLFPPPLLPIASSYKSGVVLCRAFNLVAYRSHPVTDERGNRLFVITKLA